MLNLKYKNPKRHWTKIWLGVSFFPLPFFLSFVMYKMYFEKNKGSTENLGV